MTASIILGFKAIRRRDVAQHRAWMTRAYVLALGAGTQAFTIGIGEAVDYAGWAEPCSVTSLRFQSRMLTTIAHT
jgi:hypothetical protein